MHCSQFNAAFIKQSDDRTAGRFHGVHVIDAAQLVPADAEYMSDEDTVAGYFEYDDGSTGFEVLSRSACFSCSGFKQGQDSSSAE